MRQIHPLYLECLKKYWNHDYMACIELTSKALSNETDYHPSEELLFYRLWSNCLLKIGNVQEIESFAKHLQKLSQTFSQSEDFEDTSFSAGLHSLIGCLSFDLDQVQKCQVYYKSIKNIYSQLPTWAQVYADELIVLWESRKKSERGLRNLSLMVKPHNTVDYCLFENFREVYYSHAMVLNVDDLCRHVTRIYPASPFELENTAHKAFDASRYLEAISYFERLSDLFPNRTDFLVALAVCNCFEEKTQQAAKYISILQQKTVNDLDVLMLALVTQSSHSLSHTNVEEIAKLLFLNGFDNSQFVEESFKILSKSATVTTQDEKDEKLPQLWFIDTTSGHSGSLATTENETIFTYIGNKPQNGDICFFASKTMTKGTFRLSGIFQVISQPIPNYETRFKHALKKLSLPSHSVKLEVEFVDSALNFSSQTLSTKVYEIQNGALELLNKSIEDSLLKESSGERHLLKVG